MALTLAKRLHLLSASLPALLVLAMLSCGRTHRLSEPLDQKMTPGFALQPAPAPQVWFNRYWEHWGEIDDSFHDFTAKVKPQMVQVGFFGPGYYSAITYAMEQNKPGLWTSLGGGNIDRVWWRTFIKKQHDQGIKVVSQFSLTLVFGDGDKGQGWFAWIDKHWDEKLLGPKPLKADGTPIRAVDLMQYVTGPQGGKPTLWKQTEYKIEGGAEYRLCPSNPYTREVLKRFMTAALDLGLDGIMVVFPTRENCICEHCQNGFKEHLKARYGKLGAEKKFGIVDLDKHVFVSINGWYETEQNDPLALEALKFSQLMVWECQRECVIEHGRRIKPDLMVGQWNHIYRSSMSGPGQLPGTFAQLNADERCVLPTPLWAKDENWVWYSIGNWRFGDMYYNPEKGLYSQFSLEHKYLRAAGGGLPQAVKRDDNTNIRVYFAEALAHGGFAYARGPNYKDPATVALAKQCFDFASRHEDLYRDVESYTDTALVFPRHAVHEGNISAIPDFKAIGQLLTARHVSFDVAVDEMLSEKDKAIYRRLIHPRENGLTDPADPKLAGLLAQSMIEAPPQVVAVAWKQEKPQRLLLHLVNYQNDLKAVPKDAPPEAPKDQPVAQQNIGINLKLPAHAQVKRVWVANLENPEPKPLEFKVEQGKLMARLESLLVYAVIGIELQDR